MSSSNHTPAFPVQAIPTPPEPDPPAPIPPPQGVPASVWNSLWAAFTKHGPWFVAIALLVWNRVEAIVKAPDNIAALSVKIDTLAQTTVTKKDFDDFKVEIQNEIREGFSHYPSSSSSNK